MAKILIQEIKVPGCLECQKFEKLWEAIKGDFPNAELRQIDALSPEGQALIQKHFIMTSPGIIINGELFSTGGVKKEALMLKLSTC